MKENEKTTSHLTAQDYIVHRLIECALACERCYTACLQEGDVNMMSLCIELDRDCSEICMLGAKLLQRKSEIANRFLLVCEEACRNCSIECNKHAYEHCKECAMICERCADMCHENHGSFTLI
jgi:hypothetical protein